MALAIMAAQDQSANDHLFNTPQGSCQTVAWPALPSPNQFPPELCSLGRKAHAHDTAHQYTFQTNGVIRLGREAESGGAIVWLSEEGGPNVVNNGDTGRQIQMNVRDAVGDYNPTQAGDGPNASGSLIYFTHPDYTFSQCVPLLFYNEPPYSGPTRPGYYLVYLNAGGNLTLYSPAAGMIASANVPG